MRVGFWRLLEALAKRKLRATTAINAHVVESYEPVARAMLEAGWEFMAHGVVQGAMHLLPDQRAAVRQSIEMLTKFTGRKPKGWLGPGLTETWETVDYPAGDGIEYVSDWVNDDQPYEIRTAAGRLVSVPYSIELNDIPMMVIQHHTSSEWLQRVKDQFDRLYAEGAKNPRVMALAVHPYISGVPHRIKYFEAAYDYMRKQKGVWLTTGAEIYERYRKHPWWILGHPPGIEMVGRGSYVRATRCDWRRSTGIPAGADPHHPGRLGRDAAHPADPARRRSRAARALRATQHEDRLPAILPRVAEAARGV